MRAAIVIVAFMVAAVSVSIPACSAISVKSDEPCGWDERYIFGVRFYTSIDCTEGDGGQVESLKGAIFGKGGRTDAE